MLQPPSPNIEEDENEDQHKVTDNKEISELKEINRMALKNMYTRSKSDVAGVAKAWEIRTEFNSLKEVLEKAKKELMIKDKAIELLKFESGTVKELERKIIDRDLLLEKMKTEMDCMRTSVAEMCSVMDEKRRRIEELEEELERTRMSEKKVFDSFVNQTVQLEQATILSEKLRLETVAVKEEWELSSKEENQRLREEIRKLENGERRISDTAKEEGDYFDEVNTLRNELRLSLEAEDRSKRAMDDLALALAEVAAEASLAKEKLNFTEEEVFLLRNEVNNLKKLIKNREEDHDNSINQMKKENDRLKNTVSRLRIEAEESLLGWVGKEVEFVKCIKKVEEEKERVEQEKNKLMKSMTVAEDKANRAREESSKIRDIMKQALNEANVAKEAAEIAKLENSQLKDHLLDKDKALLALAQETERLRINETELKKQVNLKDLKTETKEHHQQQQKKSRRRGGSFSGEKELKGSNSKGVLPPLLPGLLTHKLDDVMDKDDDLTDSIFDLIEEKRPQSAVGVQSATAAAAATAPTHLRRTSSNFSDDDKTFNLEELVAEHVEEKQPHLDDSNPNKKKGLLLRKFGDLWKRKTPTPSPTSNPTPNSNPNPNPNPNPNGNSTPNQTNNNSPNESQTQSPTENQTQSSNQNDGAT